MVALLGLWNRSLRWTDAGTIENTALSNLVYRNRRASIVVGRAGVMLREYGYYHQISDPRELARYQQPRPGDPPLGTRRRFRSEPSQPYIRSMMMGIDATSDTPIGFHWEFRQEYFDSRRMMQWVRTPAAVDTDTHLTLTVPLWFLVALSGAAPACWMFARLYGRDRRGGVMCSTCGYDLRATPLRCPECGSEPAQPRGSRSTIDPPATRSACAAARARAVKPRRIRCTPASNEDRSTLPRRSAPPA